MRSHKILLLIFLLLFCSVSTSFAVVVEDTIMSMSKDYVFVKYNIAEHNGKITVSFSEVRKRLGLKYRDKYRKLNDVCVLFFDRGGDYKDKFKSDIGTEPLKVRSNEIRYIQSDDGYVRLDNRTDISLDLLTDQSTLSLPIYLAHYEGKQHYKVFAKCENLNIRLSKRARKGASGNAMEVVKREIPVTEEVEVGTDMPPAQEAELLIKNVKEGLGQDNPSMATLESLGRYIDRLRDLEVVIPDKALKSEINNILQIYDSKKQAAKQQQDDEDKMERQMADQQENEKQAKGDLAYLTERLEHSEEWTEEDLGELKSCSNSLRRKAYSIENPELAQEMKDAADKCDEEIKKVEHMPEVSEAFESLNGSTIITNFDHMTMLSAYYMPDSDIYLFENTMDELVPKLLTNISGVIELGDMEELVNSNGEVYFLGSFNQREEIVDKWSKLNIKIEEVDDCLVERYWFRIYRLTPR